MSPWDQTDQTNACTWFVWRLAAPSEGPSWCGRSKNTGSPGARSAEWSISSHAACLHCRACSGLKSSKQSNFHMSALLGLCLFETKANRFIVQFRNMSCRQNVDSKRQTLEQTGGTGRTSVAVHRWTLKVGMKRQTFRRCCTTERLNKD